MFVEGNVDRFGEQKYPINPHLNVPGPGAYYSNVDSIENKQDKIIVLEEQRKLLKEWYNLWYYFFYSSNMDSIHLQSIIFLPFLR